MLCRLPASPKCRANVAMLQMMKASVFYMMYCRRLEPPDSPREGLKWFGGEGVGSMK